MNDVQNVFSDEKTEPVSVEIRKGQESFRFRFGLRLNLRLFGVKVLPNAGIFVGRKDITLTQFLYALSCAEGLRRILSIAGLPEVASMIVFEEANPPSKFEETRPLSWNAQTHK